MIFSLLVILAAVMVLAVAIVWYQPEARHRTFAVGQVWKHSTGNTMTILAIHGKAMPHKSLTIKRVVAASGAQDIIEGYPAYAFRNLIVRNRYQCV